MKNGDIVKTKKIVVKSREKLNAETLAWARRADRGQKVKGLKGDFFESLEAARNFLTEKRLELWRTIRDRAPAVLTDLAKLVRRDYKDVHQDVSILVEVGLVDQLEVKVA